MAETVTIISIRRSLRGGLVLFNPALDGLRIDASVCYQAKADVQKPNAQVGV